MHTVPFDALGVCLALSDCPGAVLVELGATPGLFQDAVIVSHDLWQPGHTLGSYPWALGESTSSSLLAAALEYDADRIISLHPDVQDKDLSSFFEKATSPIGLNFRCCDRITDAGFALLAEFTQLEKLVYSSWKSSAISDAALESLARLDSLTTLELSGCEEITDKGIAMLAKLPALEVLRVPSCRVRDPGLQALSTMKNLRELDLSGCSNITDAGVAQLVSLKNLHLLDLSYCYRITDEGVSMLSALTALRHLDLGRLPLITNSCLEAIATLDDLEYLDLSGCDKIAHDGLIVLACLTQLKTLYVTLRGRKGSSDGLAFLSSSTKL